MHTVELMTRNEIHLHTHSYRSFVNRQTLNEHTPVMLQSSKLLLSIHFFRFLLL